MSMRQEAPWPTELASLVARLEYRRGWTFGLADIDRGQGSRGLTLIVQAEVADTNRPERTIGVNHYFIVPAASYDVRAWLRWLLDRLLDVEQHEACEYFKLHDTPESAHVTRPFAPNHGPGRDPYQILETGSIADAETSFRGVRNEGSQL